MKQLLTPLPHHPRIPVTAPCPLCGEELDLGLSDDKISARWGEALAHRDRWASVATQFRAHKSIERTAEFLAITPERTEYLLQFLCAEVCGCRRATCVSCLDDYRSVL
jgi:hypothetical protein